MSILSLRKSLEPQAPTVEGGSYFQTCPRDPSGHCLPKDQADQSGQATQQPSAPVTKKETSLAARKEIGEKAAQIGFSDVTIPGDPTGDINQFTDERGRLNLEAVQDEMDREERSDMEDQMMQLRDEWIDEQTNDFEPTTDRYSLAADIMSHRDIYGKVSELIEEQGLSEDEDVAEALDKWNGNRYAEGLQGIESVMEHMSEAPEALREALQTLLDETSVEVDQAVADDEQKQADDYRERLEEDYDDTDERREYLRNFYEENPERFQTVSELEEDTWYEDEDGGAWLQFKTSGGDDFLVNIYSTQTSMGPVKTVEFRDAGGSYKVTGAGNAFEVFGKVVPAVVAYVQKHQPDPLYFTAAEESRRKLYDRLVRTVASVVPGYSAVATVKGDDLHSSRYYVLTKRENREAMESKLRGGRAVDAGGNKVDVLVKSLSCYVNPSWWSAKGWETGVGQVRTKSLDPKPPQVKGESYFASCERDEGGRCLPSGEQEDIGPDEQVEIYDARQQEVLWSGSKADADRMIQEAKEQGDSLDDLSINRAGTSPKKPARQQEEPKPQPTHTPAGIPVPPDPKPNQPGGKDWVDPPEKLYHATYAADAIAENGFKTADELGGAVLGGSKTDSVSFTTKENAETYRRGLEIAREAAQGRLPFDMGTAKAVANKFGIGPADFASLWQDSGKRRGDDADKWFHYLQGVSFRGRQFPLFMGGGWPKAVVESAKPPQVVEISSKGPEQYTYNKGETEWRIEDTSKIKVEGIVGKSGTKSLPHEGQPCEQGQTAERDKCVPEDQGGSQMQAAGQTRTEPQAPVVPEKEPEDLGEGYAFYSPNVKENVDYKEALENIDGKRQEWFRKVSDDVYSQLGIKQLSSDAVGDWTDGAENSLVNRMPASTDWETHRYATVWLGKLAKQKGVLAFRPEKDGTSVLYETTVPVTDLGELRKRLDECGIGNRTFIPTTDGNYRVMVFDEKDELGANVERFGDIYDTQITRKRGRGEFIPPNRDSGYTRAEARTVYEGVISAYEKEPNHRHYRPGRGLGVGEHHRLPDGNAEKSLRGATYGEKGLGQHKFGCLLSVLSVPIRKQITDWSISQIPNEHLAEDGRELRGHLTIKYGFKDSSEETVSALRALLARTGPIPVRLGVFSLFRNDDAHVLYVAVESPRLVELNAAVSASFDCKDTHPEYIPHVCVAYLIPEVSQSYVGLPCPVKGQTVTLTEAEFSGPDGETTTIPLEYLSTFFGSRTAALPIQDVKTKGWATIGGGKCGEEGEKGEHCGGTPVFIDDDGKVTKGPPALVGRRLPPRSGGHAESGRSTPRRRQPEAPTVRPRGGLLLGQPSEPKPPSTSADKIGPDENVDVYETDSGYVLWTGPKEQADRMMEEQARSGDPLDNVAIRRSGKPPSPPQRPEQAGAPAQPPAPSAGNPDDEVDIVGTNTGNLLYSGRRADAEALLRENPGVAHIRERTPEPVEEKPTEKQPSPDDQVELVGDATGRVLWTGTRAEIEDIIRRNPREGRNSTIRKVEPKPESAVMKQKGDGNNLPKLKKPQVKIRSTAQPEENKQRIKKLFGKDLDKGTLGAIANAVDGVDVDISIDSTGRYMTLKYGRGDIHANRSIRKDADGNVIIHNDIFEIEDHSPYKGKGAELFLNQVQALRDAGVSEIETHAAGYKGHSRFNGYYTWPRFGYDGTISEHIFDRLPENFKRKMGRSRSVLDLMELPGGKDAWKEHGGDILDAKFDLRDGSRSMKTLEAYLKERKQREGSKSLGGTGNHGAAASPAETGAGRWTTGSAENGEINPIDRRHGLRGGDRLAGRGVKALNPQPPSVPPKPVSGGKTVVLTDALGRKQCYQNGVHVPCPDQQQPQGQQGGEQQNQPEQKQEIPDTSSGTVVSLHDSNQLEQNVKKIAQAAEAHQNKGGKIALHWNGERKPVKLEQGRVIGRNGSSTDFAKLAKEGGISVEFVPLGQDSMPKEMYQDLLEVAEGKKAKPTGNYPKPAAERKPTGFKTSKGSTYVVHEDGTTTRDKAERDLPGHEGDKGKKDRTVKTVYVDGNIAAALSGAGMEGLSRTPRLLIKDGKATLVTWNEQAGKWGISPSSHNIAVSDSPAVGKSPLELWKKTDEFPGYESYKGQHAGNKITEMSYGDGQKSLIPRSPFHPETQGLFAANVWRDADGEWQLRKSVKNFTGTKKDKLGRERCYVEGKLVPCPKEQRQQQASPKPPEAPSSADLASVARMADVLSRAPFYEYRESHGSYGPLLAHQVAERLGGKAMPIEQVQTKYLTASPFRVKSIQPVSPQAGDSYFTNCPRDESGHCLPKDQADRSGMEEPQGTSKPEQTSDAKKQIQTFNDLKNVLDAYTGANGMLNAARSGLTVDWELSSDVQTNINVKWRTPRNDGGRKYVKEVSPTIKQVVDDAMSWLSKGVAKGNKGEDPFNDVEVGEIHPSKAQRSYYDHRDGTVGIAKGSSANAVVHEMGHRLELVNPAVLAAAVAFLEERTKDEPLKRMKDVLPGCGYAPSEKGRKDSWEKLFPGKPWKAYYVGKVYPNKMTEVVSMGMELMYTNPMHFARQDPEYFKLISAIMDGTIR